MGKLSMFIWTIWSVVSTSASFAASVIPELVADTIDLENITISATAIRRLEPVSYQLFDEEALDKHYLGQDPSALFEELTPGVLAFSDAGTEIGNYVQFRMRGMDQTRINTNLNGVPLNDMIDQGVFFSNFTDLIRSTSTIQIQRGVGITNGGVSSYAGSVSFRSPSLFKPHQSGGIEIFGGSFGTLGLSGEINTGLTENNTSLYTRFTRLTTKGYKDHSGSDAYSLFVSGGYLGEKEVLRFTAFAGKTQNDQAYLPVLFEDIETAPKTNYNSPNDTDDFEQVLGILQYSRFFNSRLSMTQSLYYGAAGGYFPFSLDDVTQLRYDLQNDHLGIISEWEWDYQGLRINGGLHAYTFGRINENSTTPNITAADYTDKSRKNEISLFAKSVYELGLWTIEADLQVRQVALSFETENILSYGGPVPGGDYFHDRQWTFFNPKIGISYSTGTGSLVYASWGYSKREPTRTDIFQGDGSSINEFNYASIQNSDLVVPERVNDLEAGWRWSNQTLKGQINLFHMVFHNEISQVGALAQRSYIPLRQNVPFSRRSGVEVQSDWHPTPKWSMGLNLAWMKSQVERFETANGVYTDIHHIFAPEWIIVPRILYHLNDHSRIEVSTRYVSKAFMELSNNPEFTIPEYFVMDLAWHQRISSRFDLHLAVNNISNQRYFNDGAPVDLDFDGIIEGPGFRIQAPRNIFVSVQYRY